MSEGMPNGAKIALTCSGLSHVRRGVETWSEQAFTALRRRGIDVTLFKGSGPRGDEHEAVVPCIRRNSSLSRTLSRLLPSFGWRVGFGSEYQMEQTTFALSLLGRAGKHFDILHTKDPQVALMFHYAKKAGWSSARVILNHGTEEPPEFLTRFDYVQHLAPFHLEEARQQGVRAKGQFAIPNFVDTDRFRPGSGAEMRRQLGIPVDAFVVLCVAAVKRHHKRLDWLFAEAAQIPSRPSQALYVLVVGASTDDTEAVQRVGRERLGARAVFLVDASHEQMPDIYRAADLFVLCSLKEMLGSAFLEALATGVPCLGSTHPVTRWVIGEGGESVDMERLGALADAIASYRNPARRISAGERARMRAISGFSTEVVLAQQVAMYGEVLQG